MSARGSQRERDLRAMLRDHGWWTARAAGSLGDADLVALKRGYAPMLIEVKSTGRGPFHSFGPKKRADMRQAAFIAGAKPWLVWWPPHKRPNQPDWWPVEAWPGARARGERNGRPDSYIAFPPETML